VFSSRSARRCPSTVPVRIYLARTIHRSRIASFDIVSQSKGVRFLHTIKNVSHGILFFGLWTRRILGWSECCDSFATGKGIISNSNFFMQSTGTGNGKLLTLTITVERIEIGALDYWRSGRRKIGSTIGSPWVVLVLAERGTSCEQPASSSVSVSCSVTLLVLSTE